MSAEIEPAEAAGAGVEGGAGMDVVVLASEAVPFAKTGGLADVAAALPRALARLGLRAALILPGYRGARKVGPGPWSAGPTLRIPVGSEVVEGHVARSRLGDSDVDVYLIERPEYFDRDDLYSVDGVDFPDNAQRFIFFARAALEAIRLTGLRPGVLHCNDWETGLVPVYLDQLYGDDPALGRAGTLMTVHNLAYQGLFPAEAMAATGLDGRLFNWQQLEFHGRLNFLKAGMVFADLVSTVSPTYAREIQGPELGCGLDGLVRARRDDLRAIVNGIDAATWDPATDPWLAANYDASTFEVGKAACKARLQDLAGLPGRPDVPLLAQIGRLVPQKGWDLIAGVADDLLRGDVQLVILGEGLPRYHDLLARLATEHPGKVRPFLRFSDPLAHRIQAGADLVLVPSLYEPCGLSQLYGMAYGTVPLVRATGGLADTVIDATPGALADGSATGFVFRDPTPGALRDVLDRALGLWRDRPAWARLVRAGMGADWSWDRGARAYAALYEEIRRRRAGCAAGPGESSRVGPGLRPGPAARGGTIFHPD